MPKNFSHFRPDITGAPTMHPEKDDAVLDAQIPPGQRPKTRGY